VMEEWNDVPIPWRQSSSNGSETSEMVSWAPNSWLRTIVEYSGMVLWREWSICGNCRTRNTLVEGSHG
jgi:hypothetical protein